VKRFQIVDDGGNGIVVDENDGTFLGDTAAVITMSEAGNKIATGGFTAPELVRLAEHLLKRARKFEERREEETEEFVRMCTNHATP
jgi:hypothetical protein